MRFWASIACTCISSSLTLYAEQPSDRPKTGEVLIMTEKDKCIYVKNWTDPHFGREIDIVFFGRRLGSSMIKDEILKIIIQRCDKDLANLFKNLITNAGDIDPEKHYTVKCEPYSEAFFLWTKAGLVDVITIKYYGSL